MAARSGSTSRLAPMSTRVYKLLLAAEWEKMKADGRFDGSSVDKVDGFVHLSGRDQVEETAARHFSGVRDLILLEVDPSRLEPPPRWEPSRGGRLFPHLYGPIPLEAVTRSWPLEVGTDGRHALPELA